jgi:hypothetical protein
MFHGGCLVSLKYGQSRNRSLAVRDRRSDPTPWRFCDFKKERPGRKGRPVRSQRRPCFDLGPLSDAQEPRTYGPASY